MISNMASKILRRKVFFIWKFIRIKNYKKKCLKQKIQEINYDVKMFMI